ncbi:response regulator [Scopulibacillus daqui]
MKVLLADDHPMVLKGLRFFLNIQDNIEIVGEAASGQEVVKLAETAHPDIILMDLAMPGMDGIEATKRIRASLPDIKIIILTSFSDQEHVLPALKAGANGYQLKDIEPDDLVQTIMDVHRGETKLHQQATQMLLTHVASEKKENEDSKKLFESLTPREKEVLKQMSLGKGNKEIAEALFITEKTVKTHVSNILGKLNLHDRTKAALYAIKQRWFD